MLNVSSDVRRLVVVLRSVLIALLVTLPVFASDVVEEVDEPGWQTPILYGRTNYAWPFASGPEYGTVPEERRNAAGVLHTPVGSFDLADGEPLLPESLTAKVSSAWSGHRYFVLQVTPEAIADGRLTAIEATLKNGWLRSWPVAAAVVRLDPAAYATISTLPGVLRVMPYQPAFKLSPLIGRIPLPDPLRATSETYDLDVVLFPGEDTDEARRAITEAGGRVTRVAGPQLRVELHRSRLADLARVDAVESVFEHTPIFLKGEETTDTIQTGVWANRAVPYHDAGVDGGGGATNTPQLLMVLDNGMQFDAGDLSDTRNASGWAGGGSTPLHRKTLFYSTTNPWTGSGDLLGCDPFSDGGFTHGHVVAATALGNGTRVSGTYGAGWTANTDGANWGFDGVAPKAKLLFYDADVNPGGIACDDPQRGGLNTGMLYSGGIGSLADASTRGAKTFNFSWGTVANPAYGPQAGEVDSFLDATREAMLFVAAGNEGTFGAASVSDPATAKNAVTVGGTYNQNPGGTSTQDDRWSSSSKGPATVASGRVAPILMAPAADAGTPGDNNGFDSEYACGTSDATQTDPVECILSGAHDGTSYASAAAAGAGLLVRDYFAQGFYPSGAAVAADQISLVSGTLVKAALVASADWVGTTNAPGKGLTKRYRFNNEQGYGRIQLNNVLPLTTWSDTPPGLLIADVGVAGGRNDLPTLSPIGSSTTQTAQFRVCSTTRDLRVSLAWVEGQGDVIDRDLDLELVSPSGRTYYGNYFTDDNGKDGVINLATENCNYTGQPWPPDSSNKLDASPWSLPTCGNSIHDDDNLTEAIFLSADPAGNGVSNNPGTPTNEATDNQVEIGEASNPWTVTVKSKAFLGLPQRYALVISGDVCNPSSVTLDRTSYDCNDPVVVTVRETAAPPTPTVLGVAAATTVRVFGGLCTVTKAGCSSKKPCAPLAGTCPADEEKDKLVLSATAGMTQVGGAGNFWFRSAPIVTSSSLGPDKSNDALEVRDGWWLEVTYVDPNGNLSRKATAPIACAPALGCGEVKISQLGPDAPTQIIGGCERNGLGSFGYGFPDQYMDAGELVGYRVAFANVGAVPWTNARVTLRALEGHQSCASALWTESSNVQILDGPKYVGAMPPGAVNTATFSLQISATPPDDIVMCVDVTDKVSGKTVSAHCGDTTLPLDRDEVSIYYSTDFPSGGVETRDFNNDETAQNPDGTNRYETITWSSLTATGRNGLIQAPWNFDANTGAFTTGLNSTSTLTIPTTIANWGEDKNFNNLLDPGEDRDPVNGALDQNWGTRGGCGWQTRGAGLTGGVWHTGRIDLTTSPSCLVNGASPGRCQTYETVPGNTGKDSWYELLAMPVLQKVHQCIDGTELGCTGRIDAPKQPVFQVRLLRWAWNMEMDVPDRFARLTWEWDTDVSTAYPIDLIHDLDVYGKIIGPRGAISKGMGTYPAYPLFAPFSKCVDTDGNGSLDHCGNASQLNCTSDATCTGNTVNGTLGGNRVGNNNCYFEGMVGGLVKAKKPWGLAQPPDDDIDNNSNSIIDETVLTRGPIRNMSVSSMQPQKELDDLPPSGTLFQGMLGFKVSESSLFAPTPGYGVSVDDMVVEWREFSLEDDATSCTTGQCAVVEIDRGKAYNWKGAWVKLTVLDASPYGPAGINDCDGDGDFVPISGDSVDCNGNSTPDVVVQVSSCSGWEPFVLDQVGSLPLYATSAPLSFFQAPSVICISPPFPKTIVVKYDDLSDGASPSPAPCGVVSSSLVMSAWQETPLDASTDVEPTTCDLSVVGARVQEVPGAGGDADGFADTNETVDLYLTIRNRSDAAQSGITAAVTTEDSKIDCVTRPIGVLGDLAAGASAELTIPVRFRVANVNRSSATQDFSTLFDVALRADGCEAADRRPRVRLDLDLDASGGGPPIPFIEDFEGSGFGQFTSMSLDQGLASNALSDGYRCQSSDPALQSPLTAGVDQCYLGFEDPAENAFDWHVHATSSPDGGRAYTGTRSLHFGLHTGGDPKLDSTRLGQLDALRTTNPINLPLVSSELRFKHQASFADARLQPVGENETVDRGIVQVQLADAAGNAVGNWITIEPVTNRYDAATAATPPVCIFDPIDDGNNEDALFDVPPRLGPSSSCAPEYAFSRQGDTDYRNTFHADALGRAEGPGLQGSIDRGTWVETRFDLSSFRGRRIRVRFLATTHKDGAALDNTAEGAEPDEVADDGWYIDEVRIDGALASPVNVVVDTKPNSALPFCSPLACTSVTASLTATPSSSAAPGLEVEISAALSTADMCSDGELQYRFWNDANFNGVVGDAGDELLQDWTFGPQLVDAPLATTRYGVEVRCSSLVTCRNTSTLLVAVNCPSSGFPNLYFGESARFTNKQIFSWPTTQSVDVLRGNLTLLRSSHSFTGTVQACLANDQSLNQVTDATAPPAGSGFYYIVRPTTLSYCNEVPSWSANVPRERAGRDSELQADGNACP